MTTQRTPPSPDSKKRKRQQSAEITNNMNCMRCQINVNTSKPPYLKCTSCHSLYHLKCSEIAEDFYKRFIVELKTPWFCYICYAKSCEENVVDFSEQIEQSKQDVLKSISSVYDHIKSNSSAIRQEMNEKIKLLESQTTKNIDILKKQLDEKNNQINTILRRLDQLNITSDKQDNEQLHEVLKSTRMCNIIVSGVPKRPNENLLSILSDIALKIGCPLNPTCIDKTFRIKHQRPSNIDYPERILVKFKNEVDKECLQSAYKAHIRKEGTQRLIADDIGICGKTRLYINDHLTPWMQNIVRDAIKLKKDGAIQKIYSTTSHVNILVNEKWLKITHIGQLQQFKKYPYNIDQHMNNEHHNADELHTLQSNEQK